MQKTNDKEYEIPARFTDPLVIRIDPDAPPLPKWKQEIWKKVEAAETDEEANKLLELIYGHDEEFDRFIELFESE